MKAAAMNEPRCELMGAPGERCLNQAAGFMLLPNRMLRTPGLVGRRIAVCDDCRRDLEDQASGITEPWEPLHPDPVQAAIDRRVTAMAAGYFG